MGRLLGVSDAALFCDYYNVTSGGNWEHGRNILYVSTTDEAFARKHDLGVDAWRDRLGAMRQKVHQVRSRRVPPGLDDKILAEWNGMLISTLARGYRILNEPRYRDAAVRAANFILKEMIIDGRLYRAHRRGKTHIPGNAADHANVIEALITLYETTFDRKWLTAAEQLNDTFMRFFHDSNGGGFFYTGHDAEKLIVRSKNANDGVVPSASSVAVLNLLRLSILLGREDLRDTAEQTMRTFERSLARGGLERMQWAALFYHEHPKEIAIVGDPSDSATQALVAEVYRNYLPNKVVALGTPQEALGENALPLLKRKTLVKGKPGAYVCKNYLCGRPVNAPDDLARQLEASSQ